MKIIEPAPDETPFTLIDELLHQQQQLTAVERFSQRHEQAEGPVQERYYRDLVPLSRPGAGEQYGFEVDLEACSGCKACVVACHSLNGLDEEESWREVGSLVGELDGLTAQQTVTTACHHCADPACANGCPTRAYEKMEDTGIVRHLDDQCIGCRYCELKCPYEVPKFNRRLGIVRKCDMCHGRLAEGEAPACVQSCPNEAIRIRIVPVAEIEAKAARGERLLPGTVTSDLTLPSTTFLNLREGARMRPADEEHPHPAHGHFPLVWMLVATQFGAGILSADWLAGILGAAYPPAWHPVLGLALVHAGLAGSVLHLGRPLQAWRSFLGWRTSWLSREIMVFGAWAGAATAYVATRLVGPLAFLGPVAGAATVGLGIAGVFCSVMVYADTRRRFWSLPRTAARFYLTALIAGGAWVMPGMAALALAIQLALESRIATGQVADLARAGWLMCGPLKKILVARFWLGLGATLVMAVGPVNAPAVSALALVLAFTGELLARSLFFRAVDSPKMPGSPA